MSSQVCREVKLPCDICGGSEPDDYRLLYPLFDMEVVQCRRCGLVFVNAPFDPAIYDEDEYWAEEAYAENESAFTAEARQVLARIESFGPKGKLLDVGCGFGYFVKAAAERGWDASGVEINRKLAAAASERWNLPILGGDLQQAAFPDETFQAVTLFNVIEHLLRPSEVVGEAVRVLRSGGLMVIETPAEDGLPKRVHRMVYRLGLGNFAHEFYQWGGHHHGFSAPTLGRLLEKYGARICRTEMLVSPAKVFVRKQLLRIRDSGGFRQKIRPLLAIAAVAGAGPLMRLTGTGNRMRVYARKDG